MRKSNRARAVAQTKILEGYGDLRVVNHYTSTNDRDCDQYNRGTLEDDNLYFARRTDFNVENHQDFYVLDGGGRDIDDNRSYRYNTTSKEVDLSGIDKLYIDRNFAKNPADGYELELELVDHRSKSAGRRSRKRRQREKINKCLVETRVDDVQIVSSKNGEIKLRA